ncbi:adhesion G protein-coupled receptor E3-like isoform X3 [Heterodontus francisci]|uniref:adhesion G protein-coupled receptor E3-like isoform X3 n=1 Tax=Heterodontus francisci TaxID=7792 RepID=UPI00355BBE9C
MPTLAQKIRAESLRERKSFSKMKSTYWANLLVVVWNQFAVMDVPIECLALSSNSSASGSGDSFLDDEDLVSICGPHALYHEAEGGFYCTCEEGYDPTAGEAIFTDGTGCRENLFQDFDDLKSLNILILQLHQKSSSVTGIVNLTESIVGNTEWESLEPHTKHNVASKLLQTVSSSLIATALKAPDGTLTASSESLDVEVRVHRGNISENERLTLNVRGNKMELYWRTATGGNHSGVAAIGFIAYSNMDSILDGDFVDEGNGKRKKMGEGYQLNSDVVTVTMGTGHSTELHEPINFTLKHKEDEFALHIITLIGASLSLICLGISTITFAFCRSIQSETRTIHMNLSLSLFLAQFLFITGISRTGNKIVCGIIAGFLHYFFLVAFAWMFLEGLHLFLIVRDLRKVKCSRIIAIRNIHLYAIGYVPPAAVLGISAAINLSGFGTSRHCWLQLERGFIWSFLGPVCFIILVNTALLTSILWILQKQLSSLNSEVSKIKNTRMLTLKTTAQVFVLGCTWIFGLFHFGKETVVMAYLFTIANSFQGTFIFIILCVLNKQVRKEYRKCFGGMKKPGLRTESASTSVGTATLGKMSIVESKV